MMICNTFFINCPKVLEFWNYWINCWENISGIEIKNINSPVLQKCIPNSQIPTHKKKKKYMYLIIAFYTPNTSRDYSRIISYMSMLAKCRLK